MKSQNTGELPINNTLVNIYQHEHYFSPEECEHVVALSKTREGEAAKVLDRGTVAVDAMRDSQVRFVEATPESEWIFQKLYRAVMDANQGFHFHLAGLEPLQVEVDPIPDTVIPPL